MLSPLPLTHTRGGWWVEKPGRADLPMGTSSLRVTSRRTSGPPTPFLPTQRTNHLSSQNWSPLPFKLSTALYHRIALGSLAIYS